LSFLQTASTVPVCLRLHTPLSGRSSTSPTAATLMRLTHARTHVHAHVHSHTYTHGPLSCVSTERQNRNEWMDGTRAAPHSRTATKCGCASWRPSSGTSAGSSSRCPVCECVISECECRSVSPFCLFVCPSVRSRLCVYRRLSVHGVLLFWSSLRSGKEGFLKFLATSRGVESQKSRDRAAIALDVAIWSASFLWLSHLAHTSSDSLITNSRCPACCLPLVLVVLSWRLQRRATEWHNVAANTTWLFAFGAAPAR
jgi:hypothetical protein